MAYDLWIIALTLLFAPPIALAVFWINNIIADFDQSHVDRDIEGK